jgi:hypothetical protein
MSVLKASANALSFSENLAEIDSVFATCCLLALSIFTISVVALILSSFGLP